MPKSSIPLICIVIIIALSCTYHNEEEYFGSTACDTIDMSYGNHIKPILEASCISCHNSSTAYGSVDLGNYSGVAAAAKSGKLISTIKHESGFSPMPSGQPKLDSCTILKIEAWVNGGFKNN